MDWRTTIVAAAMDKVRETIQDLVDNSGIDDSIAHGLHRLADVVDEIADRVDAIDQHEPDIEPDINEPEAVDPKEDA